MRLTPAGIEPIDGVVDYATDAFLGVRSADALYRVYGRDAWGWPVGVAHHLFADGVDQASRRAGLERLAGRRLRDRGGGVMAQYAVLIYERVRRRDGPPAGGHGGATRQLPERIAEQGGRVVAGLALEPDETATSIRGGLITDGPFIETKEALAGVFVHRGARPRPRAGAGQADADRRRRRRGPAAGRLRGRGGELSAVEQAVADAHRREWAYVLAATVRVTRDLDAAEEAVQDAYVQALRTWARDGVPDRPGAWLTTVARRTALNAMRRRRTLEAKLPLLLEPEAGEHARARRDDDAIPDDRLRLIFTCCHPALASEAQVALTLRLVCGVATPDIAHAFLVAEPTMAARLTRAKKKIAAARIPYAVPSAR